MFRNQFGSNLVWLNQTFSGIKGNFATEIQKLHAQNLKAESQVNLTDLNIRTLSEGLFYRFDIVKNFVPVFGYFLYQYLDTFCTSIWIFLYQYLNTFCTSMWILFVPVFGYFLYQYFNIFCTSIRILFVPIFEYFLYQYVDTF